MPLPLAAIGLGIGLIGSIGKMIGRGKANRQMDRLLTQDPVYKENPLARERMGLAKTLLNARMPGASQVERNIFATQAGQLGQINRNATDASMALNLAGASQGQTNQALGQLGVAEAQDYQRRFQNLSAAQEGVINEGDKVYQDQTRRFGNLAQIRAAQNENRQNNWQEVGNFGFGAANFGLSGGFKSIFGGGGGRMGAGRTAFGVRASGPFGG